MNLFTYGSLVRSFWRVFAVCVAAAVIAFLQACAQANRQTGDQSTGTGLALPSDFFLDKKAFAGPASIGTSQSTVSNAGDALGLATCCVLGAERATAHGASGVAAVLLGVMSATFGGLVRDVMCNEVPLILRKEIYATAAAAGAGVYVLCHAWGLERTVMISVAFLVAFCIRALALRYQLSLPTYRSRAGRDI